MGVLHPLDSHRCCDEGMRVVVLDDEILDLVVEDALRPPGEAQRRVWAWLTRQLQRHLLAVVVVDVRVATRPDERSDLQVALLCNHVSQQRIAGDVERDAEEHVRAALGQLAGEHAIDHVELEHRVARRQFHLRYLRGVPGSHDESPGVRVALDVGDDLLDLVERASSRQWPAAPLYAVDGTQVAVLLGERFVLENAPLVLSELRIPFRRVGRRNGLPCLLEVGLKRPLRPDVIVVLKQVADVAVPLKEPHQLRGDQAKAHELRREQRKPLREVVAYLRPEYADRSGASTIPLVGSGLEHLLQKILIRRFHLCDCIRQFISPKNKACSNNTPPAITIYGLPGLCQKLIALVYRL